MTIAEKLETIAKNEQKVYNAGFLEGEQGGYDEFWNNYQSGGQRTDYRCAFAGAGWSEETFKPKYDIVPELGYMIFSRYTKAVKDIPAFNAKGGAKIDLTKIDYMNSTHMFYINDFIEHIGEIGNESLMRMHYMFDACHSLHTIDGITAAETCDFTHAFDRCFGLKNITFRSIINSNIDLSKATLLTHDSLIGIINQLKDNSGKSVTRKLTIGTQNLDKLTDAEKAIATQKGWTLA